MGVEPELQEAEQVVQVDLPIPFGVQAQRKVDPRKLPGKPGLDESGVLVVGRALAGFHARDVSAGRFLGQGLRRPALFVVGALHRTAPAAGT